MLSLAHNTKGLQFPKRLARILKQRLSTWINPCLKAIKKRCFIQADGLSMHCKAMPGSLQIQRQYRIQIVSRWSMCQRYTECEKKRSAVSPAQILLRQAVRLLLLKNMPCLSRACLRTINKPFSPYLSISSPDCSPNAFKATSNIATSACRRSHFVHVLQVSWTICVQKSCFCYYLDCEPEQDRLVRAGKTHIVLQFATGIKYQRE